MKITLAVSLGLLLVATATTAAGAAEKNCCKPDSPCTSTFKVVRKDTHEPIQGYEVSLTNDCTGDRLVGTTDKQGEVKFSVCESEMSDVTADLPERGSDGGHCRGANITVEVEVSPWFEDDPARDPGPET